MRTSAIPYSHLLQQNIQDLLEQILNGHYGITLTGGFK